MSQAGWIIPIAAAKSPSASFIALWSGPVCTVSEELYFSSIAENDPKFWKHHSTDDVSEHMKSIVYRSDDVNPEVSLSQLNIPGLWIFGGADNSIPVDLSISRLKDLIARGKSAFEFHVESKATHILTDQTFPFMVEWIAKTARRVSLKPVDSRKEIGPTAIAR